jgi:thioesterase domain-containing protein
LGGWSSGAVMAYEMAQQLESSGGSVSILAMIDPPPPPEGPGNEKDAAALVAGFAALGRPSERQMELIREMLDGLDVDAGLDLLVEMGQAEAVLPPYVDKPWLRELFEIFSRNVEAFQGYVPRPYGGQVTLFRADASLAPGTTDPTWGWGALAATEVHLLLDAHHESLLRRPVLDRLVEHLQSGLLRSGM